jgi:endonuclease III
MPWDAADLKNYRYMAFAANVEKANRILDQNSDDIAEAVKLVGKGLKTINFALLCYSDFLFSRTAICVDTHAIGVALGRRLSPKETSAVFASEKKYTEIKMAYMRASEKVRGLRGSQMQAITWLTWKRIHAI